MALLRCLRGSSGAGLCQKWFELTYVIEGDLLEVCQPIGGAPRDPPPQTPRPRAYRIQPYTHFPASIQVRYCRYSRLHRSELPKSFVLQIFGLGPPSDKAFRFKRAAFYMSLKSKVGLVAAKASALRINLNIQGCSIVAPPLHAPSRAPLLLPLLLSHNIPLPRVH
jgi:hypothetical protein